MKQQYIAWFDTLRMSDVANVGGKNASLGEMISQLASGVTAPTKSSLRSRLPVRVAWPTANSRGIFMREA